MHPLDPFRRKDRTVPLTASEYAEATGITIFKARGCLMKLVRMGYLKRKEISGRPQFMLPGQEESA